MPVFQITKPQPTQHEQIAEGMLEFANQVGEQLVRVYRSGKEMLWNRPDFTAADAQAVIDAMGDHAIPLFTLSAALGEFIAEKYPGSLAADELTAPVRYTVENGRIILDSNATYPGVP
jgi:hypothetical protein